MVEWSSVTLSELLISDISEEELLHHKYMIGYFPKWPA